MRGARWSIYRAFFELLGFLGATVAVFFSTVMLFTEIGNITELVRITASPRFTSFQLWIEATSFIYALFVRVVLLGDKDIYDELKKSQDDKLEHFEKLFPDEARKYEIARLRKINPYLTDEELGKLTRHWY